MSNSHVVAAPTEVVLAPAESASTQTAQVGRSRGRFGRMLLFAVTSAILMITTVQASGPAGADYQPCTNYRGTTGCGRVEVDTRPAGADSIGGIAWAMLINDISHIPGRYDYQILINGRNLLTDTLHKHDNLPMTIPRYQDCRYVYESGDEIQVIASHAAGKLCT